MELRFDRMFLGNRVIPIDAKVVAVPKYRCLLYTSVGRFRRVDLQHRLQLAIEGRDTRRNALDQLRVLGECVPACRDPARLDAVAHGVSFHLNGQPQTAVLRPAQPNAR